MLRLTSILLICLMAMPVMAQSAITAKQIESIPFEESATQNISPLMSENSMEAEVEGHDAHGEAKAGLPQFDVTTFSSQLFWLAISFGILYFFFSRYALPSISSTIEERRSLINDDLKQADKLSAQVEKTRADYEQAMQKAYNDARLSVSSTEQHMREQAEIQAKQFKDNAVVAIQNLEKKAESAKEAIKADLKSIAQDLTGELIQKLSGLKVTDATISKAVNTCADSSAKITNKKAA